MVDGVFDARLVDFDLLEPPGEGPVAVEVLEVGVGGRA